MQVFNRLTQRVGSSRLRRMSNRLSPILLSPLLVAFGATQQARAAGLFNTPPGIFQLSNSNADGTFSVSSDGTSLVLTGGNTGSGLSGMTTYSSTALAPGLITFGWSYQSLDMPGFDDAGYILRSSRVLLSDTTGDSGMASFSVSPGDTYGWFVDTADNMGEPGVLSVTAQLTTVSSVPEPGGFGLFLSGLLLVAGLSSTARRRRPVAIAATWAAVLAGASAFGQVTTQGHYIPASVTGQLTLVRTTTPQAATPAAQAALAPSLTARRSASQVGAPLAAAAGLEVATTPLSYPHPELLRSGLAAAAQPRLSGFTAFAARAAAANTSLPILPTSGGIGFPGLSHADQRNANSGNQFSVEPPNPSIAVANGLILEGVNNAVQVFSQSGSRLIRTISSNELFGVAPAIDRATGIYGVFPTDMRVYYDGDIARWFVLQRVLDVDSAGIPTSHSHIYMAVTQTADPLGTWNIYVMDTTNAANPGCPCVSDFPQIGSDRYGFYISANEYSTDSPVLIDAAILAISKKSLGQGAVAPPTYRFLIPLSTGYEFSIQPATTAPGASNVISNGGLEYFVSSQAFFAVDNRLGIWALTNTASLDGANPALVLTQSTVATKSYIYPGIANQKPGPIPYGDSLSQGLSFIDGNQDSRVQSVSYSGGRLFVSLPTEVIDDQGNSVVGGLIVVLSPVFRSSVLSATVLTQGFLSVRNNHLLRPAIAVNSQGRGSIAFTLVGPDYYPSAAFSTVDFATLPVNVAIRGAGAGPEDGFSGYFPSATAPVARWGDYSTAVASADGSIWMVAEYIPNTPRTQLANWGTFIYQYVP